MDEDQSGAAPEGAEAPGTFQIALDAFGGSAPQAGGTFKAKVVSVDENSGMVTAMVMMTPKRGRGIQEAASDFGTDRGM